MITKLGKAHKGLKDTNWLKICSLDTQTDVLVLSINDVAID